MKKAILVFAALVLASCAAPPTNTDNQSQTANPTVSSGHGADLQSPHSQQPTGAPIATPPSSSNGGRSPMERAIDTAEMDAAIEKAAKEFKQKPKDAGVKTALAEAYFVRATALTEAAQYRSALGDYRRGLKLDPTNAEAKQMQDQIISIFQSLNRAPPKEGEEPAPLPFQKSEKDSSAQTAVRVEFRAGANEKTMTGRLKDYQDRAAFVINVNQGQNLRIEQVKSDDSAHYVTLGIYDPAGKNATDGEANCNNRKLIENTAAGDYRVEVVECRKANVWQGTYELKFTVK